MWNYNQSEIRLPLTVPDLEEATFGVKQCGNEIEALPKNMHWTQDPAGTVFNLNRDNFK